MNYKQYKQAVADQLGLTLSCVESNYEEFLEIFYYNCDPIETCVTYCQDLDEQVIANMESYYYGY